MSIYQTFRSTLLAGAAALAASSPAAATPKLPHIAKVTFTAAPDGSYTALISGSHFGPVPAGIPCSACAPQQLELTDLISPNAAETINITGWTSTAITVTGITASPGDPMRLAVWSGNAANAAAWGGLVSPATGAPHIKSITTSGSGASLTVTVNGTGFGAAPTGLLGQTTNSANFVFTEYSAASASTGIGASGDYPWNAGFCAASECDGVTLGYVSWTPTQIVVSGFGGSYGGNGWVSAPGDAFCVAVWPSTSTTPGLAGGASKCARLPASP